MTRDCPQWINRVWVRQEFLLATATTLYYGSNTLEVPSKHEEIQSVYSVVHNRELGHNVESAAFWETLHVLSRMRGRLPTHLGEAANLLLAAESQDPRDRVHALLALIRTKESGILEVDYARSCDWAYAQATRAKLIGSSSLRALEETDVVRKSSTERLPSWTIDYSLTPHEGSHHLYRIVQESCLQWPGHSTAGQDAQDRLKMRSEEWNVLRLTGVEVGVVMDTGILTKESIATTEPLLEDVPSSSISADLVRHAILLQRGLIVDIPSQELRGLSTYPRSTWVQALTC